MYANQLTASIKFDNVSSRYFRGVYSCDKLLSENFSQHQKCFVIVNTAPSNSMGLHWILLYKTSKSSKIIIFDSLAKKPEYYGACFMKSIHHFASFTKYPYNFVLSNKVIQSDASKTCGIYCIYFAYELSRRKSINMIALKFSNNKSENDTQIILWFKKYFHKKIPFFTLNNQSCLCEKEWNK